MQSSFFFKCLEEEEGALWLPSQHWEYPGHWEYTDEAAGIPRDPTVGSHYSRCLIKQIQMEIMEGHTTGSPNIARTEHMISSYVANKNSGVKLTQCLIHMYVCMCVHTCACVCVCVICTSVQYFVTAKKGKCDLRLHEW